MDFDFEDAAKAIILGFCAVVIGAFLFCVVRDLL